MSRQLYDGQTQHVWSVTHITALASTFFSLLGVSYVFVKTWCLSRTRRLDVSHKLPAIISICDVIFNFHHAIDHLYSMATSRVANGALCTWLGFGSLVGLESTALWSLILAVYMSSLVVFGMRLDLERFFWLVAAIGWGLPIIANTTAASVNDIGDAGMFCMVNGRISSVIMKPALFLAVFFFITICYIAIALKITWHYHRPRRDNTKKTTEFSVSFRASQRGKLQRVGLHLIGFTIVYMLQFFPSCILVFTTAVGKKPGLALNVLDKILSNGNGWMNAIVYQHFLRQSQGKPGSKNIRPEVGEKVNLDTLSNKFASSDVKISVMVSSQNNPS